MTDRIRLDDMTDDALDQLYAERDRLTAELTDYDQRVHQLEDLLRIAHDTSNKSETARAAAEADLTELTQARQHGAFTFCPQLVGHVTVAEFARKISEKRTALAQHAEAVQYANEQQQRADHAEAALARVRAIHSRGPRTNACNDCGQPWPCEVTRALDQPTPGAATQTTG